FVCSVWAFIPGVGLAVLETTPLPARLAAGAWRGLPAVLAALGIAGDGGIFLLSDNTPAALPSVATTALLSVATGALVAARLCRHWAGETRWRTLDNRPLRWLGKRSYGLYLLQ